MAWLGDLGGRVEQGVAIAVEADLSDPASPAALFDAAARQTAQRYTWPALARQVAAVYLQVTGKPRPA